MPQEGGVHHIGYWVDNLPGRGEPARHARLPSYATAGTTPLLNRGPSGTLIELCDLHSDRPPMPWHPSTAHVRSGHRRAGHRYFDQDKPS